MFLLNIVLLVSVLDMQVAKVLFAETANCNYKERYLVMSVIKNRVNHKAFNNPKTIREVVFQTNQFSCINDSKNNQLERFEQIFHGKECSVVELQNFKHSVLLTSGKFESYNDIVAYHDKSITIPNSWQNNIWWNYYKIVETEHFIFYGLKEK